MRLFLFVCFYQNKLFHLDMHRYSTTTGATYFVCAVKILSFIRIILEAYEFEYDLLSSVTYSACNIDHWYALISYNMCTSYYYKVKILFIRVNW